MPVPDIIRDAPLGSLLRVLTRNRIFQYIEEKSDFKLPEEYLHILDTSEKTPNHDAIRRRQSESSQNTPDQTFEAEVDLEQARRVITSSSIRSTPYTSEALQVDLMLRSQRTKSVSIIPTRTSDGVILVDWYRTDDPENPKNWSSLKKSAVVFMLCFYTWTVYLAGPIWAASAESGLTDRFHVSPVAASLGLSLYVLAYGIGDLLFSPITEIPIVGRNPVYYLTFIVFWVLSFGPPVVDSFGGLLALRFWLGFFGSPALANGGATMGDMFSVIYIPYGLCWWVFSAWCGPAFGPLIGGFAAMAKGWTWPMWEVVWIASPVLVLLLLFMPETSADKILLHRARRLRKLTGDPRLQSQGEINQRNLSGRQILFSALIRPVEITFKDPSIFFVNLYTGYFYGVFYTFFEVFPLVFPPLYGFNLGETGLAFMSCLIGVCVAILAYFAYLHFYMVPDNLKNGFREQEHRLVPAMIGSLLLPIGLFLFAWTAKPSIHWVAPLTGVAIFCCGHFWTMQSLFIYIPFSYPQYAASLFASNSIWRSATAGASVVFARPLFLNLGIARGVSLLGGLSVMGIIGTTAIYVWGKQLRARSKFAVG
ncbi:Transporter mfs1 [Cyphellophora attinorum]|uniref:Transporter mfs1 n=1 Tax=Cyphellophora attinorum TaxID=1664694 RepID=A0A0N1H4C3_9EURO|nr:Transporter mfs1 [Phialophora attinorum]KPI40070.1 Transporter mfs1 [Phialophora attinorum]